jgi:hypothetical protein
MAEALGTALSIVGAVGVLAQIFDGCLKASQRTARLQDPNRRDAVVGVGSRMGSC